MSGAPLGQSARRLSVSPEAEIADLHARLNEALAENERRQFVDRENVRLLRETKELRAEIAALKRDRINERADEKRERNRLTAEVVRLGGTPPAVPDRPSRPGSPWNTPAVGEPC